MATLMSNATTGGTYLAEDAQVPVLLTMGWAVVSGGAGGASVGTQEYALLSEVRGSSAGEAVLWDDFERTDRLLVGDTAPTGHVWTGDATVVGHPKIVNGRFSTPVSGAAYLAADLTVPPDRMSCDFAFLPGTTGGAAVGLIISKTTTGGFDAAIRSVHLAIGPTTWSIGYYEADQTGLLDVTHSGTFATALTDDGETTYTVSMTRDGDRIILDLPARDNVTLSRTITVGPDARIGRFWGQRVVWENYQPGASFATDSRPEILRVSAYRFGSGGGQPRSMGASLGMLGLPGNVIVSGNGSAVLAANFDLSWPIEARDTWTLKAATVTVASGATAGAKAYISLYETDVNNQPGRLVKAIGEANLSTTGLKTVTPAAPAVIPAGRYSVMINVNNATPALIYYGHYLPDTPALFVVGSDIYFATYRYAARTYSTTPLPVAGTVISYGAGGVPGTCPVLLDWTP